MKLATRLSAFFLIALALVLTGFSGTLYLLARNFLVRQLDERLLSAVDTLEASVDIEPGGLEWEPADRQITLGVDQGPTAVRWVVRDGRGELVDRSANVNTSRFPSAWQPASWPSHPIDATAFGVGAGWRLAGRRLRLDDLLRQGRGHPDDEPGAGGRSGTSPRRGDSQLVGFNPGGFVGRRLVDGCGDGPMALRASAHTRKLHGQGSDCHDGGRPGQAASGARDG